MISVLLRPKILTAKNAVSIRSVLRRLPFLLIGAGLCVLFYYGTYTVLFHVRAIEFFGEIIAGKLLSMIFYSLFWFLILSNTITALSSFYLSRDIPFLLSKPVALRDIIRLKTIETIFRSSWMVAVFILPVFIAYGVSYTLSLPFYIILCAAFTFLLLIAAGAGISIAHILAGFFPAKKSRDLLLMIFFVLFVSLYFTVKWLISGEQAGYENLIDSLLRFNPDSPFSPAYWTGKAVLPFLGKKLPDFLYVLALISSSAFFLLLASWTGSRLYRTSLDKLESSGKRTVRRAFGACYPGRRSALFYKDAKLFFRDAGQWSQIFIIGALIAIYTYNFKSIPLQAIADLSPHIREILVLINLLLLGLVLSAIAARFLFTSVSLEGRAFWLIRSSPARLRSFLWSKFLNGLVPVTLVMVFFAYLTNSVINAGSLLTVLSMISIFLLCITVCGLGTGFGAMYPKFEYENIASVSMSLGSMAFMAIAFSTVLFAISAEAWVYYCYGLHHGTLSLSQKGEIAMWILGILGIHALALFLPMKMGTKRLEDQEQ